MSKVLKNIAENFQEFFKYLGSNNNCKSSFDF